ncbi:SAV_6107 family HEPN domain-containing protein [Streptomyces youssoufiensis]
MRADSFAAQVLGNLARTSPPFSTGRSPVPARATRARPFRSWLLHALAFAPVSDDLSRRDAMHASYCGSRKPTEHAKNGTQAMQQHPSQDAVPLSPADMVARARRAMETAHAWDGPLRQYAAIHYAALYAANAVLAVRQRPEHRHGRRARVRNEWKLLAEVVPDLAEFAEYFNKTTATYIRAREGMFGAVDTHELQELRQMAVRFMNGVDALADVKNATTAPTHGTSSYTTVRRIS